MNTKAENTAEINMLTEQVIATDLLNAAKTGVRSYAIALTEAATPEVRNTLRRHLNDAITTHEKISSYMMHKGWYNASDINQQIKMDMQNAHTAMNLPD